MEDAKGVSFGAGAYQHEGTRSEDRGGSAVVVDLATGTTAHQAAVEYFYAGAQSDEDGDEEEEEGEGKEEDLGGRGGSSSGGERSAAAARNADEEELGERPAVAVAPALSHGAVERDSEDGTRESSGSGASRLEVHVVPDPGSGALPRSA